MAATYATVSAKLGKVDAATKSISKEIFDAAAKAGHEIWYMWGMGTGSEHKTGRALDFMVRNESAGDWIRNYIWTNRERLRLQHVIWEQHITSTVTQKGVRRKMADRGDVTQNHMDHVHVLFFAGAYKAPGSKTPPKKKTDAEIAQEIFAGKGGWGNNPDRKRKLLAAGYSPAKVQVEVDKLMNRKTGPKSVKEVADEVYRGIWGNGDARKKKLRDAGYDPVDVQREVNKLVKKR